MKIELLKKQHARASFWLEMIEESIKRVEYYKTELDMEYNTSFPFLFYDKKWHEDRIIYAKVLVHYCIDRYKLNQLKLEL